MRSACRLALVLLMTAPTGLPVAPASSQQPLLNMSDPAGAWRGEVVCGSGTVRLDLIVDQRTGLDEFNGTVRIEVNGEHKFSANAFRFFPRDGYMRIELQNWPRRPAELEGIVAIAGSPQGGLRGGLRSFRLQFIGTQDCPDLLLHRVYDAPPFVNPVPEIPPEFRRELESLEIYLPNDRDRRQQPAWAARLRELAPSVEPYFLSLIAADGDWVEQGDWRILANINKAFELIDDDERVRHWRDLWLLISAKEGIPGGDYVTVMPYYLLLSDAQLRQSAAYDRALALLKSDYLGDNSCAGALPAICVLRSAGSVLREGGAAQSGLRLLASARDLVNRTQREDPVPLFQLQIDEAIEWWEQGGASRVPTLLKEMQEIVANNAALLPPALLARFHALQASVSEAELRLTETARQFQLALNHARRADAATIDGSYDRDARVLLQAIAERHSGTLCRGCPEQLANLSRAFLADAKLRTEPAEPLSLRRDRKKATAHFLQRHFSGEGDEEAVAAFLKSKTREAALRTRELSFDRFIDHYGHFGNFSETMKRASLIVQSFGFHGFKLQQEVALERIVHIWFYRWGEVRKTSGRAEAANFATILAPQFVQLAKLQARSRSLKDYPEHLREAHRMIQAKLDREWQIGGEGAVGALRHLRPTMFGVARLLLSAEPKSRSLRQEMREHGLELLQLAMLSDTAAALNVAVQNRTIEGYGLTALMQRRGELFQDISDFEAIEKQHTWFLKPLGAQDAGRRARAELKSIEERIAATGFGQVADKLAVAKVPTTVEIAHLLAEDVRALLVASDDEGTITVLVHPNGGMQVNLSNLTLEVLGQRVTALRDGLKITSKGFRPYPVIKAYALFQDVFGPLAADLLKANRVVSAVSGPLESLPLGVLVAKRPPVANVDETNARSAGIAWVGQVLADTRTPSLSAFKALAESSSNHPDRKSFWGIGDPILSGHHVASARPDLAGVTRSGGIADVNLLRRLSSLPETADELSALSQSMGFVERDVLLREAATEERVKRSDLSRFGILAFATHGVIAGAAFDGSEPGLVLTPPDKGSQEDDGFLSMSEVAQLKLDAELIVLSACDTATSDGRPMADGLSGLARAFFVAGARNLLATHWEIPSLPSVEVTTRMMAAYRDAVEKGQASGGGWALSLQKAQSELIEYVGDSSFAHPASWGAFQVIGAR